MASRKQRGAARKNISNQSRKAKTDFKAFTKENPQSSRKASSES